MDSLPSGAASWWQDKADGEHPLTVAQYAAALLPELRGLGLKILLEPGRFLVGNAGVLLTRVLYEKRGTAKTFKIADAGMNDLIRPALYQGHHEMVTVKEPAADAERELVDIVGPICETGDFLAKDRELPPVEEGDLLAVMSAGAYGFTMSSNYNTRPMAAEVMVTGPSAHLIRERQTWGDLIRGEKLLD